MQEQDTLETTIPAAVSFACLKCDKAFGSENALRMHKMRVHTRAGKYGALWQKGGAKPIQVRRKHLAKRRAYQARIRAKNLAMGLTSTGTQRIRKKHQLDTKAVRNEYKRNWYHKQKRIRIVYPEPGTQPEAYTPEQPDASQHIKYCPYCKNNIERLIYNE